MSPGENNQFDEGHTLRISNEQFSLGTEFDTGIAAVGGLSISNSTIAAYQINIGRTSQASSSPSLDPIGTITDSELTVSDSLTVSEGTTTISGSTINGNVKATNVGTTDATNVGSGHVILSDSTVNGALVSSFRSAFDLDNSHVVSASGLGAMLVGGGTLSLVNGSSITGGVSGLDISGQAGYSPAPTTVTVDASSISATAGSAVTVEFAAASMSADLVVRNGGSLNGANGVMVNVLDTYHGTLNFTADNVNLAGDIVAADTATMNVTMQNHGNIAGAMTGVDTLSMANSTWDLAGDSTTGSIVSNAGQIHTGSSHLATGGLSGTGSLTSDLARLDTGPAVHVGGDMSGTWAVGVTDTQHNYTGGELKSVYTVADVGGVNSATVSGQSDIGAFKYESKVDANGAVIVEQQTTTPPVTPVEPGPPVVGPGEPILNDGATAAVNAMSVAAAKAIWDTQFSALHLRQQSLRQFKPGQGSFWVQGYNGNYKLDNGYGAGNDTFDARVSGLSIGADKLVHQSEESNAYIGAYASVFGQDRNASGSSGKTHGYSVGLYGNWLHQTGWYVEGMVAFGDFDNSYSANYFGDPTRSVVNARDWDANSNAFYLEAGKQIGVGDGWVVQPAVGVRYLHQNSQHFTTDVGHEVSADEVGSVGANVSLTFTKMFEHGNQVYNPYLRIGYADEFAGTQTVHYAGAAIDTKLDATRFFVNLGVSAQIAKRHELFVDYQYQNGHNVENTYLVNLGYRYSF